MEEIIKKANEIVNEADKPNRKEEAFKHFEMGVMFAGLAMCGVSNDKRTDAINEMMDVTIKILSKDGFVVRGKPMEFEAKFKFVQLKGLLGLVETPEELNQHIRETFDEDIWNVCLFDTRSEIK